MHSGQTSQEIQGIQNGQSFSSSTWTSVDQTCARYFKLSEEKLLSTLELLRAYQTVLHAGVNFARLFGVPLTSDLKAEGLGFLFSKPEPPQILEVGQAKDDSIHWSDVIRSLNYDPELQENGNYRVRIDKGQALVELSKDDHEFIKTGIPRQIINPQSYPGDVISEINTVKSVMAQIAPWKDLTVQMTETINNVLEGLSERMNTLQKKNTLEIPGNPASGLPAIQSGALIPFKNRGLSHTATKGKKRNSRGESWDDGEVKRLPGWFEDNQNLPKEEIELTKLYQGGHGHLSNKRKKVSRGKHDAPKQQTSSAAPFIPNASADRSQLSLALSLISASSSSASQQSPRLRKLGNEVNLGNSPLRDCQRSRSGSQNRNQPPDSAFEKTFQDLVEKPEGRSILDESNENVSGRMKDAVAQSKETHANASPPAHSAPANCEQKKRSLGFERAERTEISFSESAYLDTLSLPPYSQDQSTRIISDVSSPSKSSDGFSRANARCLSSNSPKNTPSCATPKQGKVMTPEYRSGRDSLEKKKSRDEMGIVQANDNSTVIQKANVNPTCLNPSPVAGAVPASEEPHKTGLQSNDVNVNARQKKPIWSQDQTKAGSSYVNMQGTINKGLRPDTENERESHKVINVPNGKGNVDQDSTSRGQPLEDVRVATQGEQTQHLDLTLKPAHEFLNQESRNFDTGSRSVGPDAKPPSLARHLHTSAEYASQPLPDLNQAYTVKTGCVTCGRRRKACDKKYPSCGVCARDGKPCEGYKQSAIRRMPRASKCVEQNSDVHAQSSEPKPQIRDQFIAIEQGRLRGLSSATIHATQPSVQQYYDNNSRAINDLWCANGVHETFLPSNTVGAYNQQPSPNHEPSPNCRSLCEKQTIPSIQQLLKETDNRGNLTFVSQQKGGWATVNGQ